MDQTEITEKKQPYIEVSYTLNKSEKFPKEEITVKVVEPLYGKKNDTTEVETLQKEMEYRIKAAKTAVKNNLEV